MCVINSLGSVIIVVHGTFASNETWYRSNGDFVNSLKESMHFLPVDDFCKNASIVSFRWSGNNNGSARLEAARDLLELVLSYPATEPIVLVLHSHAGNVGALLTNLLVNPFLTLNRSVPHDLAAEELVKKLQVERCIAACADASVAREEIAQFVERGRAAVASQLISEGALCRNVDQLFEQRRIQRIYFLATPVDVSAYACDMSVVQTCYALYSTEDMVQRVGGFYNRKFPQTKQFFNFRVKKYAKSGRIVGLGHSELRSPLIGFWLLLLPYQTAQVEGVAVTDHHRYEKMNLLFFENNIPPLPTFNSLNKLSSKELERYLEKTKPFKKENIPDISIGYVECSAQLCL